MDKYFGSDSGSDSSGEFYDNPFFVEDDKFEREFEKTLALFDALLIGEDSHDAFSLSSSPGLTLLKFDAPKVRASFGVNSSSRARSSTVPRHNIHNEVNEEERPKSFLHDEVSEFNRLLKELSDMPLTGMCCPATLGRTQRTCRDQSHQHSFSSTLPSNSLSNSPRGDADTGPLSDDGHDFETLDENRFTMGEDKDGDCQGNLSNDRDLSVPLRSRSNEELFSSCSECIKRMSCRNIIESGFFESLKTLRSCGSVPADNWSILETSDQDWGSYSLDGRHSTSGRLPCSTLQAKSLGFRAKDARRSGRKDGSDSAYQTGSTDTLKSSTTSLCLLPGAQNTTVGGLESLTSEWGARLEERLSRFNENKLGLRLERAEGKENSYQGTIRVHLNLVQPISMRLGSSDRHPASWEVDGGEAVDDEGGKLLKHLSTPSDLNVPNDDVEDPSDSCRLQSLPGQGNRYASFYLPPDISRVIHVTSESTSTAVIKVLLNKFQIANNASRFALFQRTYDRPADVEAATTEAENNGSSDSLNLTRPLTCHMRKLGDDERPLDILLGVVDEVGVVALEMIHFVLQEYSSGEIIWDAFSVPELNNFLTILAKEEQMKIAEVERKYADFKDVIVARIEELRESTA